MHACAASKDEMVTLPRNKRCARRVARVRICRSSAAILLNVLGV